MKVFLICYNILVLNFCIIFNEKFVEGRKGIMAKMTYMGGIRIHEGKELSRCAHDRSLPKGDLVFPLSQHIGHRQSHWFLREIRYWLDRLLVKLTVWFLPI